MTGPSSVSIPDDVSLADLHRVAATAARVLHDIDELRVDYGWPEDMVERHCMDLIAAAMDRAPDIPATTVDEAMIQLTFALQAIEQMDSMTAEGSKAEAKLRLIRKSVEGAARALCGLVTDKVDGELVEHLTGLREVA
jgi:hypothetical protein